MEWMKVLTIVLSSVSMWLWSRREDASDRRDAQSRIDSSRKETQSQMREDRKELLGKFDSLEKKLDDFKYDLKDHGNRILRLEENK